jgi:outer membrane protein OmpA-like peptidoglycan-associated protein
LDVKEGENYYIGVVQISGYGCGHNFSFSTNNRTLTLKAIQNECIEDVINVLDENIAVEEEVNLIETPKKPIEPEEKAIVEPIEKINYLNGVVVNTNTQNNIEATVSFYNIKGEPYDEKYSSVDSGFVVIYPIDSLIVVSIKKFGYEYLLDTLDLTSDTIKVELTPIKVGEKLIMYKVYFHPNTYVLKEESKKELKELKIFMLENVDYSFEIQGHTNGNKTIKKTKRFAHLGDEWNFKGTAKKLSKLRAEKIKTYLVANGVEDAKLQTIGYGGDRMIIEKPKHMKQAMKNIRVEVIIIQ